MKEEFSTAVSTAIRVFDYQKGVHGINKATCEGFVNKVTNIFKSFSGAPELEDTRGLEGFLKICKSAGVDTTEIEEFIPLGAQLD